MNTNLHEYNSRAIFLASGKWSMCRFNYGESATINRVEFEVVRGIVSQCMEGANG